MFQQETKVTPEKNLAVRLLKRIVRVTDEPYHPKFFVRHKAVTFATSLLIALVVIETTELDFCIRLYPSYLPITTNVFIVYTSNIFAVLGLRALYFLLSGV